MTILTVGHGTLPLEGFVELLDGAAIEHIADIRRFPGSTRHPWFNKDALEGALASAGLGYVWLESLGGRRQALPDSPNVALRNDAFRGYADHMQTAAFLRGVDDLLSLGAAAQTAVLCSESVWWRCHRRLVADHLSLVRGIDVTHLMHDGRRTAHPATDGARRAGPTVIYDAIDRRAP
jgi:uncharacterized protein (DUF488 family)